MFQIEQQSLIEAFVIAQQKFAERARLLWELISIISTKKARSEDLVANAKIK